VSVSEAGSSILLRACPALALVDHSWSSRQ